MTLLNPAGLIWAALAIPIIALYILRVRRRRQVVPTLMFWDQILRDAAPKSLWRQFRHWLSLLMQLAFLALLVAALGDPIASGASGKPVHYVIVIDQSASMQATDGDPTRFDEARHHAHRIIRSMRDHDQGTIIAAGIQPAIACGRTHHPRTLHHVVDELSPIDAPAALVKAVQLARSIDVGEDERRVIVATDAAGARSLTQREGLIVRTCGKNTSNMAITGFAVRSRADNPLELQGLLRVANLGNEPVEAQVRLSLDDTLVDLITMTLDAGQEDQRRFQRIHAGGRVLQARLLGEDAMAIDNEAFTILPRVREKRVALVTEGNLFLESVLASHPLLQVDVVAPADAADSVTGADIVVYHEYVPEQLPDKPCLFIYPTKSSPLWQLGDELRNPLVSDLSDKSPLMQHVNLRNVAFHRAVRVEPTKPANEIVTSFEHPLLLSWAAASPPVVLLAIDINQSDLPWRTAFPILMQNALNYLSGRDAERPSSHATGTAVSVPFKADAAEDDDDKPVPMHVAEDGTTVGPVASIGVVTLHRGEEIDAMAFNLASREESDLRAVDGETFRAGDEAAMADATGGLPWWIVLAVAACLLSTVEWCMYQRRLVD